MRWRLIIPGLICSLLLMLTAVGYWILQTEKGTSASLALLPKFLPELTLDGVSGSWREGIKIDTVHWRQPRVRLQISDVSFKLSLSALFRIELQLQYLKANSLQIDTTPNLQSDAAVTLPNLAAPILIDIHQLAVNEVLINQQGQKQIAAQLQAKNISWKINTVSLENLVIIANDTRLTAAGEIKLRGSYPLAVTAKLIDKHFEQTLEVQISGTLAELNLTTKTSGNFSMLASGQVNLLEHQLPFKAATTLAKPLTLAIAGHELALPKGQLKIQGDKHIQSGQLEMGFKETIYDESHLVTSFQLNWPELTLADISLTTGLQGQVNANCEVQLEARHWDCKGDIEKLGLEYWLKSPSMLSGLFASEGVFNDQLNTFTFSLPSISGKINNYALTGDIAIRLLPDGSWEIPGSSLQVGDNQVNAAGWLDGNKKLNINWQFNNLSTIVPAAQGRASGKAVLSGTLDGLNAIGELQVSHLKWQEWQIAEGSADFDIMEKARKASVLNLTLNQVTFKQYAFKKTKLRLSGTTQQHFLNANVNGYTADQTLNLHCRGALKKPGWQGECTDISGTVQLNDQNIKAALQQPIKLKWQQEEALFSVSRACLAAFPGKLCLPNGLRVKQGNAAARITLQDIPVRWLPVFQAAKLSLAERAVFDASFNLLGSSPLKAEGNVTSSTIDWQIQLDDETQTGGLDELNLFFKVDKSAAHIQGMALSKWGTQLQAQLNVSEPTTNRGLDGNIRIQVKDANEFAWLIQDITSIKGQADIDIALAGTLLKPDIRGHVSANGSQIVVGLLDQPIGKYQLSANFEGSNAAYSAQFQVGTGKGALQGQSNWQNLNALQSNNQLTLDQVGVNLPGGGTATFDANLQLDVVENQIITKGTVGLINAHVLLDTLPPGSASVSSDTVVIGEPMERAGATQLITDVQVNLGKNLRFTGHGADFYLTGNLRLQNDQQHINYTTGKVTVEQGQYRAYGQKLKVRKGELLFAGPFDNPIINLEAVRPSIDDQIAGIRVTGYLQQPTSELFSEPAMAETDTAYYLVTGRKRQDNGLGEMSADAVLLSLGVGTLSSGVTKFAEQFGVKDFQVSANQTVEGTSAQVSGYITPRLFISYGTDSSATGDETNAAVTLRYRLSQHLIIESISGFNSALDVFYSFEID